MNSKGSWDGGRKAYELIWEAEPKAPKQNWLLHKISSHLVFAITSSGLPEANLFFASALQNLGNDFLTILHIITMRTNQTNS